MPTQQDVEHKVFDYVLNNRVAYPRFILMDSKTYDGYCKSFQPKEKIKFNNNEFLTENAEEPSLKIVTQHVYDYHLEILKVDSDKTIFEVVG